MQNEILRYQPNKRSRNFVMIAMVFMVVALFMVINAFRYHRDENEIRLILPNIWLGIEILVAIFVMLLSFLLGEKFKTYDKKWTYVGFSLTAYSVIKIFIYPIKLFKRFNVMINAGVEIKYNPYKWLITVISFLAFSAIFYFLGSITNYFDAAKLDNYYKELELSERD